MTSLIFVIYLRNCLEILSFPWKKKIFKTTIINMFNGYFGIQIFIWKNMHSLSIFFLTIYRYFNILVNIFMKTWLKPKLLEAVNYATSQCWLQFRLIRCSKLWNIFTKPAILQGMVDGSTSKPALRQDTGYLVEKTYYDIAQYLGDFRAYLMPQ